MEIQSESLFNKITLYRNNNVCSIICGDSRDILKNISGKVDLIVTSPPYADARSDHYDSISPDEYADWFLTFHEPFYNILSDEGSFVLNIKDKVVNGVRHRYVWDTVKKLSENGWYAIDDYIWHKTNPMPGYWPTRLSDGWEYCFHFSKSKKPYFNREAVLKPIGDWANSRLKNLNGNDISRHNSANKSGFGRDLSKWVGKEKVSPTNVLSLALVGKNKGHPAVFPVDLPQFFIKLLCPPGGIVFDPFSGSGTTGVAALIENRDVILIDNNRNYFLETISRIGKETQVTSNPVLVLPGTLREKRSNY